MNTADSKPGVDISTHLPAVVSEESSCPFLLKNQIKEDPGWIQRPTSLYLTNQQLQ